MNTVQEPLRDRVGRALYEEPGANYNWYDLSEDRREPWRKDADRIIPIVLNDYAAILSERNRAQEACQKMGERLSVECTHSWCDPFDGITRCRKCGATQEPSDD